MSFYSLPLTAEAHAAYLSMPKASDGCVKSLVYTPEKELPYYEPKWGAWFRANPKRLWPTWAQSWIDKRRLEQGRAAA